MTVGARPLPDPSSDRPRSVIAHAGGIDEMVFVLIPLLVFGVLQWLSRRKAARAPETEPDAAARLEQRRRLAGGLVPNPGTEGRDPEAPPEGTPPDDP